MAVRGWLLRGGETGAKTREFAADTAAKTAIEGRVIKSQTRIAQGKARRNVAANAVRAASGRFC